MLKPAAVFSSEMVLQQGRDIPVWGQAAAGAMVHCTLKMAGQTVSAAGCAAADGHWQLKLPALPAGGPCTLLLCAGPEKITFTDVYIGEVWLAGGQSNMELTLANSQNGAEAVAACQNPRLHFYETPKVTTVEAARQAESRWHTVTPETAGNISAVAYYAAKKIAKETGLHIGVLECFWGGTYAHCWLPRELLATFPQGKRRVAWYDAQIGDKTDAAFAEECIAYQQKVDDWNDRIAKRRAAEPDVSWATLDKDCGLYPWPPPAGRTAYQRPGNLYESMLRQVCPYAVRGFWYYQGEQDEEWPQDYGALLRQLIAHWRADWQDTKNELSFLLMQLPMYQSSGRDWSTLRAAQAAAAAELPNTGLVVLADCGERDNIHPVDKKTPGSRLALLALDSVYHLPVQGHAPQMVGVQFADGAAVVRFCHTAGGLTVQGKGQGFELAGTDGIYHPAAMVCIAPDTVRVTCPAVPEPVAARYAWYNFGPAELYGKTGLAAAPFCCQE